MSNSHSAKPKKKTSKKSKTPRPNYKSPKLHTQRASVDNALIHHRNKKKAKTPSRPRPRTPNPTPSRNKHSQSIESKHAKTRIKSNPKPGTPKSKPKSTTTKRPSTPLKPKTKKKPTAKRPSTPKPRSKKKTSYKKPKKKSQKSPRTPQSSSLSLSHAQSERRPKSTSPPSTNQSKSKKAKSPRTHKGRNTPKSPQSSSLSLNHTHSVRTPKSKSSSSQRTPTAKPSLNRAESVRPAKKKSKSKSKNKSTNPSQRSSVGIDARKNLSPNNSPNKRKKVSNKKSKKPSTKQNKKRCFYSDIYSTKTKGKLQTFYKVKEKIGSGTFSTVRRGIRRSDKLEIAIKIITKTELNDTESRLIKREIGVMQKLDHANIVRLYDIFETQHHLYLVIEYCRGGELFDELINCTPSGWFSERETSQIIRQIADALHFMHGKDIIHRDLKLENILIAMKKNYAINLRQRMFSIDPNKLDAKTNKKDRKRGGSSHNIASTFDDEYPDESESESEDDFINRRHSEHISQIPPSLLYGANGNHINDHKQSSIIVKVSDFGLSKKLNRRQPLDAQHEEMKSETQDTHKKKRKIHILPKKKKWKSVELSNSQYAVMATNCGTLYYVAPEILNNKPYNEKVDMWSLGVICYVLLCGSLPFYSENELEISDAICSGKYDLGEEDEHWLKVSDSAKDLIAKLLTLDKVARLSASQVLAHPFITGQQSATKRKSVRWNAGALLGKWPMKFKHIMDSAKVTFGTDSDNSASDYEGTHNKNKKGKYKISIDSDGGAD
eukprot:98586_1